MLGQFPPENGYCYSDSTSCRCRSGPISEDPEVFGSDLDPHCVPKNVPYPIRSSHSQRRPLQFCGRESERVRAPDPAEIAGKADEDLLRLMFQSTRTTRLSVFHKFS